MKPIIIAVAITGSVPRKKDNPAVPVTPAEQIESTHEAFEAEASLVHIHVRNPDESPSSDPALFAQVQEGVRKHCPGMIVQFSTGGRGRDPAARGSALHLKPDMASLANVADRHTIAHLRNRRVVVLAEHLERAVLELRGLRLFGCDRIRGVSGLPRQMLFARSITERAPDRHRPLA
jgi:uncharacterized protein (DUF849 family)